MKTPPRISSAPALANSVNPLGLTAFVLVGDHEERGEVADALRGKGCDVRLLQDSEELLKALQSHGPGKVLLVVAVKLAGPQSGWSVARLARATRPDFHVVYLGEGFEYEWSFEGVPGSRLASGRAELDRALAAVLPND